MNSGGRTVLQSGRAPDPAWIPDGATVLTPHRRAAAAVGQAYRSLAQRAAEDHARAGGRIASRLRRWRALTDAVRVVAPEGDLAALRGTLEAPVREALRSGLVDATLPAGVSEAASRAVRVARTYRDALAAEGDIDPAELFRVAARGAERHGERVALLGFPALDEGACAYLDVIAGDGSVVVLPPEETDTAARLARLGWVETRDGFGGEGWTVGARWAARFTGTVPPTGTPPPLPEALRVPSHDDEVREVLVRVARARAQGVPAHDTIVAARDPVAWAGRVAEVAWEFGVPVRMGHAVTVAETDVGGLIALLGEVVRRGAPFEPTARLLGHRLVGGWAADRWREVRGVRPEGPEAWTAFDARAAQLDWPSEDTREGYADRLGAALTALGLPRDGLAPHDVAVLHLLRRGVADACRPAAQRVGLGTFLADVDDLASLLRVRAAPVGPADAAEPVDFVDLQALGGARVPHLFVLGAYEGALPAPVRDDPVIDFADRRLLVGAGVDLDDAAGRARREEAAFAGALRAADVSLTLTVPRRASDGPLLPSPYLARLGFEGGAPRPAPARSPASVEEFRRAHLQAAPERGGHDPVLRAAHRAWQVELAREGPGPAAAHDGVTGRPRDPERTGFSATRIVDLGRCPFRWFARYVLGAEAPEEAEEAITPRLRGRLWHRALERAGALALARLRERGEVQADGAPSAEAGDLGARLREEVEAHLPRAYRAAEAEARVPDTPAWRRLRGGEIRALQRLVRGDAFLRQGYLPVAFEASFEGRWRGLSVAGVVDRIDAGPEGLELIDYKSGAGRPMGAKDASGWGNVDVQLPLYLESAAQVLYPDRPLRGARYVSVRAADTVASTEPGAREEALDELAARLRGHLRAGSYPVDPDRRKQACRSCDLAAVCRVGPRVDRKHDAAPVPGAGEGA